MQAIITNSKLAEKIIQGETEARRRIAAAIEQLEKEQLENYPSRNNQFLTIIGNRSQSANDSEKT